MTYILLYIFSLACIWWISRVGYIEAFKKIVSVLIPSTLAILFNIKAGSFLFRNPIVGIISLLPTILFIYKASAPLVAVINNWIDRTRNNFVDAKNVVEADVISKEDA